LQYRGDRDSAAVMRQAAAGEHSRPCGHRRPRGIEDIHPQLCLTRAEHGKPDRVRRDWCAGKPTVRRAQVPGGNRMPKKRMPAAERRQETGTVWLPLQVAVAG
jgi:hypothetical protein